MAELIRKVDERGVFYWVKPTEQDKEEEKNLDIVEETPSEIDQAIDEVEEEE